MEHLATTAMFSKSSRDQGLKDNPFFLLSALCMLLGCWLLVEALSLAPGRLSGLFFVLACLNLYEGLLAGLSWLLRTHLGQRRQAWLLFGLESMFLLDPTLLYQECLVGAGSWLVYGLFLLAAVGKVALLLKIAERPAANFPWPRLGVGLALLFGFAAFLSAGEAAATLSSSSLLWWACGAWLAWTGRRSQPEEREQLWLFRWECLLAVSVLVHLFATQMAWQLPWWPSLLTPMVLAFGYSWNHWQKTGERTLSQARLVFGALAVAIFLAETAPLHPTSWHLPAGILLSQTRLVLLLGALWMTECWLLGWHNALFYGAAFFVAALSGAHLGAIWDNWSWLLQGTGEALASCIPTTPFQWGLLLFVSAFALLGTGLRRSLRQE